MLKKDSCRRHDGMSPLSLFAENRRIPRQSFVHRLLQHFEVLLVVFDRNGRIVGEPLLGGIDNEKNLEMLQKTMEEALARDSAVISK